MAITSLHVAGYRSIRDLHLELGQVNVLTGPHGCGKSNLYQAMYLLTSAARGDLARSIALEGGMPSALWAGQRVKRSRGEPVRVALTATFDEIQYDLEFGMPQPSPGVGPDDSSMFQLDPEVKEERVALVLQNANGPLKRTVLLERFGQIVHARNAAGSRVDFRDLVSPSEAVLSSLSEPDNFPQVAAVTSHLNAWRFYQHFRTDPESPLRAPRVGFRSPILDTNGTNLAAALQTIREVGDEEALRHSIASAFGGAQLQIELQNGRFLLGLLMPGVQRPLFAAEFSDGTLRFLCLLAALLSPRPPGVLAINEPETSLHPDLLEPLAKLMAQASLNSQLWITTHSRQLAALVADHTAADPIELEKVLGETRIKRPF